LVETVLAETNRFSKRIPLQDLNDSIHNLLVAETSRQRSARGDIESGAQRAAAACTTAECTWRECLRQTVFSDAVECGIAFICGRNLLTVAADGQSDQQGAQECQ